MRTPAEHYAKADQLLVDAEKLWEENHTTRDETTAEAVHLAVRLLIDKAHVHSTLALYDDGEDSYITRLNTALDTAERYLRDLDSRLGLAEQDVTPSPSGSVIRDTDRATIGIGTGDTGQFLVKTEKDGGWSIVDEHKRQRIDLSFPAALMRNLAEQLGLEVKAK